MKNSLIKKYIIEIIITLIVVTIDILAKIFLFGKNLSILPFVLGVREVGHLNTGGAWGVLGDSMWLLILFTIIFLAVVVFVEARFRIKHPLYILSLSLVVGGAVGNLLDRIFLGGVRDFLYFEFWQSYPTFNFADMFLVVGMILLAIYVIFLSNEKKVTK